MPSSSYGTSPGIPFRSMFSHRWFTVGWLRYATKSDYIAIVTGILALAITSSVNPYASKTNADFKTVLLNETTTIDYKVDNLKPYVALTMIYIAIMFVGSYVGLLMFAYFCKRQITQYNHHYLNAIMSKDITYFDTNIPTTMAHKLTAIDPEIGEKLGYFVYVALLLFVNIIVACCRNLTMALCGNLLTLVYLLTYFIYYLYTRSINVKRNRIAAMLQNLVADVFSGVFAVITSANQEKEIEKHDQLVKKHTKLTQKTKLALSCFMGINSFSSGMAIFVVYYIGAIIYYDTGEDYAHLWSVSWLVMSALVFTWCVAPYFPLLLNSLKAIEDVLRIIDEPVPKKSTGSLSSKLVGNLAYNNVNFTYPSRPTISVLSDVNIEIPFGSKVAFVGRSGSGKSTAAMLLTGLRTPTNGRISIDNLSIKTLNSQSLRSFIGFVPQEPTFFTASVSDNLKLGFDVSDDILVDACKTAHAFDFIQKLPAGFDTMLGAGGIRLSGGQKQRLAIARALIRNPKILILDEATSALDAESEAIVMNAVIKASKARTVIIIAHRLATIEKADDIFVFNDGTIAEHGKHDYLIKLNGVYAESVKTQKLNELGENNNAISTKIGFEQEEMIEHEVRPEEIKSTSLLQLFKFSRRQTWIFVFGFVITALTGVTTSPFISLIGDFYSAMDDPRSEGLSKGRTLILKSLVVNVCSGVCVGVGGYLLAVYGLKIAMKLRRQCYANILHQDGYFFDKPANTHGNLAKILSTDPHYFDAAFDLNLALVLGDLFTFFGLNISAGLKSWQLPLSACIILIVLMVAACVAAMWITTQDQKSAHLSSVAARLLTEGIQNIETIHFHNAENFFIQSHSKTHAEISKLFWRKSLINGVFSSFGILLPMCGSLFVLSLGVPFLKAGMISPNLVATTSDAISCRVIFQAMAYFPVYARSRVALTNLYNLATHNIVMNTTPELPESIQKHVLGRLTFKNVTFAYPNRPNLPIMKKFNLDVSTGSTVALVGASGCGKSTIVQLLAKMYRPSDGTITLDGHTLSGYRNSFAIVSQEPTLFDLTIAENIAYGCPFKPTFKDIQNAAILANIHEFIQNLPQNYDTIMGVRGTQLSGGQRQRVSLARAFLRDSKVLILDEATSALDAKNESINLETLKMTSKKKTCIIVAHRLATVRDSDLIVVLEAGNIVESGTHDELVAMKGAYQRLVSNQ